MNCHPTPTISRAWRPVRRWIRTHAAAVATVGCVSGGVAVGCSPACAVREAAAVSDIQTDEGEWGYIDIGPRALADTLRRRVTLFCGIVFREWHAGRIGPVTSWKVCKIIHPWRESVMVWGVVSP